MIEPYQIVLDIWEANSDLDYPTLLSYNIAGIIVRINDMQGGHHMDAKFAVNWPAAKQLPVRAIYFVYNPWVDGPANYAWLAAHLPSDFASRLFADIEVKYPGYGPDTYAVEVAKFIALCKAQWKISIYTGAWFLPTLSFWPADVDYWWGAYPNSLNTGESISWVEFNNRLDLLKFAYNGASCPGGINNISAWQCSGGGVIMPGFGAHKVDVSVFPGTLGDLRIWMGYGSQPIPQPATPTDSQLLQTMAVQLLQMSSDIMAIAGRPPCSIT
jgi:GH25 family lysozyme M1 (1,4-beta-N-acetylmuramidase)